MSRFPGADLLPLLRDAIPADTARQALADEHIDAAAGRSEGRVWRVLDLGCGDGRSYDAFRARDPLVEWTGLDIEGSAEVTQRTRTDATFVAFDGQRIPFENGRFDLIFCKQVLEHVRRPEPLVAEVARCLAPGGAFAGSTSQLEPFHSRSTQNLTPYGLSELMRGAGLCPVELRPGLDAATLIAWRALGSPNAFLRWWASESPGNRLLELAGRLRRLEVEQRNALKLLFCGQFVFLARRQRD